MVGKDLCGGVRKFTSERNGTVVGFDSKGNRGSSVVSGRGTCTVGKVILYKTGVSSMVGQDLCVVLIKVALERKRKLV